MTEPQILVADPAKRQPDRFQSDPQAAWRLVSWVGLALGAVAYGDMFLGLWPLRIGDPQWEFGTVSRLMDSLPLVTMSTLLFFAGSVATGSRVLIRLVGIWSVVFAVVLLVGMALYALTLPLALGSVVDPVAKSGLKRAIAKTLLQGAVYPATFLALGVYGIRKRGTVSPE